MASPACAGLTLEDELNRIPPPHEWGGLRIKAQEQTLAKAPSP